MTMKISRSINSWHSANAFLTRNKANVERRTVPGIRSTSLVRMPGDAIAVIYHATAVVVYYRTGGIVLNSGGFTTRTTVSRINVFASQNLCIRKGKIIFPNKTIFVDGAKIGLPVQADLLSA
jgi:hypothetical protein